MGEYSDHSETISKVFDLVTESLGDLPIVDPDAPELEVDIDKQKTTNTKQVAENKVKFLFLFTCRL